MIRGTSNQTIKTVTRDPVGLCQMRELGPIAGGGGHGTGSEGSVEYREMDNSPTGIVFIPSDSHLPWATTQVTDNTPP